MSAETGSVGVVVTRGEGPQGPLTRILRKRGARVLHWGTIGFAPPEDPVPLAEALDDLSAFHWIYFSSPRAVDAVLAQVPQPPDGVKVAAVGPSTARSLRAAGWPVDRVPAEATGEGLVEAFSLAGDAEGTRVLFPASAIARDVVREGLAFLGAKVRQVTAYRTVVLPLDRGACQEEFERGEVQVVTFSSPSTLRGLEEGLGEALFKRLTREIPAAALGPTTSRALHSAGWLRVVVARETTLEALAHAALVAAGPRNHGIRN